MNHTTLRKTVALIAVLISGVLAACAFGEAPVKLPKPKFDAPKEKGDLQTAVLAGGCFWGVEGVYEHVRGVHDVKSGYAGGTKQSAAYKTVSGGNTGHAESVQIVFDPAQISYGELLQIFFSVAHDPTQLNEQGPDHGPQYRSDIFYANDLQKDIATRYIAQLDAAKVYRSPIVTRVDPLEGFYAAEASHQDFIDKNPRYPYIVVNDLPKLHNLEVMFPDVYVTKSAAMTASRG
jgi:peptide-methionine (S)-S-oxide reductase